MCLFISQLARTACYSETSTFPRFHNCYSFFRPIKAGTSCVNEEQFYHCWTLDGSSWLNVIKLRYDLSLIFQSARSDSMCSVLTRVPYMGNMTLSGRSKEGGFSTYCIATILAHECSNVNLQVPAHLDHSMHLQEGSSSSYVAAFKFQFR